MADRSYEVDLKVKAKPEAHAGDPEPGPHAWPGGYRRLFPDQDSGRGSDGGDVITSPWPAWSGATGPLPVRRGDRSASRTGAQPAVRPLGRRRDAGRRRDPRSARGNRLGCAADGPARHLRIRPRPASATASCASRSWPKRFVTTPIDRWTTAFRPGRLADARTSCGPPARPSPQPDGAAGRRRCAGRPLSCRCR